MSEVENEEQLANERRGGEVFGCCGNGPKRFGRKPRRSIRSYFKEK